MHVMVHISAINEVECTISCNNAHYATLNACECTITCIITAIQQEETITQLHAKQANKHTCFGITMLMHV